MKHEWMAMLIINIFSKGFWKCVIFTIHRNFPTLDISTSFQSSKCNIHVGRPTSPPILFTSFHFNRSIPKAFSFTNKSHIVYIILISIMIMQTIVVNCMQISKDNLLERALYWRNDTVHISGHRPSLCILGQLGQCMIKCTQICFLEHNDNIPNW